MAYDALNTLSAAVTVTATTNGTGVTLPYGTPRKGLEARVGYSAMSAATGTVTVTFSIDHAADGTNYATLASAQPIKASATAVSGEIGIPFITPTNATVNSKVRLTSTFSGGATTPTTIYFSDLGLAFP